MKNYLLLLALTLCATAATAAPKQHSLLSPDGTVYGGPAVLKKAVHSSINRSVPAQAYRKAVVKDNFNQLELIYKDFKLTFRVYDNGVAYRFTSCSKKDFKVLKGIMT